MKKVTIGYFIPWLLLGILGLALVTACNYSSTPNMSSREQSATDCRVVDHIFRETCVPANPQRIVTLSIPTLSDVLLLGIKPIGSSRINSSQYVLPYLRNKLDGIKSLGEEQPNLERLLLLKPNLIVGLNWEKAIYPLLSKIAPTVLDNWGGTETWREHFNFVAEALGRQEAAQQVWKNYYQRVEQLKTALGDRYKNKEISLVFLSTGVIFSEAKSSFPDSILKDVGLQRSKAQDVILPYTQLYLSIEELEKADGDILFVGTFSADSQKFLDKLKQNPLWKKLRAVQQNHVYSIDYMTWRGGNLLAADAVIDDLYKYLVNIP